MKATGIIRKVDDLGRIVIPIELRRVLGIDIKDPVEIFVEDDKIILKKYVPNNACTITGEVTADNFRLPGTDIIVSPKGAEILLEHLKRELNKKSV